MIHKKRATIPCAHCGVIFKPRNDHQRLCSLKCKGAVYSARMQAVEFCKRGHPLKGNKRSNGQCATCRSEDLRAATIAKGVRPKWMDVCVRGHPLTSDNLKKNKRGHLVCLTCHRDKERERKRALGARPLVRTKDREVCNAGHVLTDATRRKGKRHAGECLICHRLRQQKVWDKESRQYAHAIVSDPCAYCGGEGGALDHIVARKNGGLDHWSNFTAVCHSCNSRKRTKSMLLFMCEAVTAPEIKVRKAT